MKLKLIHGDCLEEMKRLPDRSIDLFLCDLPYGCLADNRKKQPTITRADNGRPLPRMNERITGCGWDIKIDLEKFWEQVERLMKDDHTPIIHFCNTKFGFELMKSKEAWFRYDLVWNKMRGVSFLTANKMPMRSHENIYVFAKKGARYNRIDIEGDFPKSIASNPRKTIQGQVLPNKLQDNTGKRCVLSIVDANGYSTRKKGQHPTQKPDDLYKWLIERYSNPGDTILDPTAGSFSSCRVALECGRQAIGIEKDDKFYEKAKSQLLHD
jgi:DNA modification methylase